jgi:hypothetical protein
MLTLLPFLFFAQTPSCTDVRIKALQGQAAPEGGRLAGATLPYGANLGAGGKVAFVSAISGTSRNQAVMVSDGVTLRAIAVGCGGEGGEGAPGSCGDPTPIGGTFAGFFRGPWYAPVLDEAGDVLFLSDVFGGGTSRGLFLHRESTGLLETIAYVGQLSPSGATITGLGPGSLDANGGVVFLARTQPGIGRANEILANDGGLLTLVAAEGGAGPDGPYDFVSTTLEICHDGTSVTLAPVPVRDAQGRVAHGGGTTTSQGVGLVLTTPGRAPEWIARDHLPTPVGGYFDQFGAAAFAPNGELYFEARYTWTNGWRTGVFAGRPGNLRKILASFDPIGTSTCAAMDRSANPFRWIGRSGEIVLWTRIQHADLSFGEAIVRVRANGVAEILAEPGDPGPAGGVITELGKYPSIDEGGRVLQSAIVDAGAPRNTIWITEPCGTPETFCEGKPSSLGCTPRIAGFGSASATSSGAFLVNADSVPSHRTAYLLYGPGAASTPFQGGTLCVAQSLHRTPATTSTGPAPADCSGALSFDFGARIASGVDPTLAAGATIAAQWLVRDPVDPQGFGTALSDAILFTIAP